MKIPIDDLGLDPDTRMVADALLKECPYTEFTSGARSIEDQARAMAQNTVNNRNWILETYMVSPCSAALVHWLLTNPQKTSLADIESGFLLVLGAYSSRELQRLSKHIVPNGTIDQARAFDVLPVKGTHGERICSNLRKQALAKGGKFLEKEGSLVRWHFQLP